MNDVIVVSSLVESQGQGQGDLTGTVGAAALARVPSRPIGLTGPRRASRRSGS